MNRFVYLVHADYRSPTAPSIGVLPGARSPSQKLARLAAEMRRYLPDSQAQILGERIRQDPDVIRVTVVTTLDEVFADWAFVRFIQACKGHRLLEEAATR
jgi:hypothetical protein